MQNMFERFTLCICNITIMYNEIMPLCEYHIIFLGNIDTYLRDTKYILLYLSVRVCISTMKHAAVHIYNNYRKRHSRYY